MRVTSEMTTEGGERLDKLADYLGTDGITGVKIKDDYDSITFAVDSCKWPNEAITMDLDTAADFARDLLARVARLR
jgi:hypothetical protein